MRFSGRSRRVGPTLCLCSQWPGASRTRRQSDRNRSIHAASTLGRRLKAREKRSTTGTRRETERLGGSVRKTPKVLSSTRDKCSPARGQKRLMSVRTRRAFSEMAAESQSRPVFVHPERIANGRTCPGCWDADRRTKTPEDRSGAATVDSRRKRKPDSAEWGQKLGSAHKCATGRRVCCNPDGSDELV